MDFEQAAAFSRSQLPQLTNVPSTRLGNWLDRGRLWQDMPIVPGAPAAYRVTHLFDLIGLAGMIHVGLPLAEAASIVRNFGFYRSFLHDKEQVFRLSKRANGWSASWSSDDIATVSINTRAIANQLFARIDALPLSVPYREGFDTLIGKMADRDMLDEALIRPSKAA